MGDAVMTVDLIEWLENWYVGRCDGEWEHECGVEIETLDNPGWSLQVDVGDELRAFERVEWEEGEEWLHAWLEDGQLNVTCGPRSLRRALRLVREALSA
jgi:Immunity protein 53